ncbi:prolyl-tRNA synthetase associated domain-containing protein [Massilia sp. METH4]|uniref:prolyl-tRNA synthetase associated domain-containing protein n=1 Tax=Massilia sp. METH4 TaxID=3123041 RepID=UPI0030CD451C
MDMLEATAEGGLWDLFAGQNWAFEAVEHDPVFTIEEALAAVPHLGGVKTKNVFVRDGKGQRHILVIVPHDRRVDMAELGRQLPATRLSMASAERLQRHLGVTPGAVSIFAIVNDKDHAVELVIDEAVWKADKVQGHPLRNTSTMAVPHATLEAFLAYTGHEPRVMRVP